MTYLEVIDTAVKVGLGALISGISAYLMAKSKNNDDLRRERQIGEGRPKIEREDDGV